MNEEELEYTNQAHLKYATDISRQRASMEGENLMLMAAGRQRLVQLNEQRQAEAVAREQRRLAQNDESR
jgi:hypothetical protein